MHRYEILRKGKEHTNELRAVSQQLYRRDAKSIEVDGELFKRLLGADINKRKSTVFNLISYVLFLFRIDVIYLL